MQPGELDARRTLALSAAREAGTLTLRDFRRDDLLVELKRDATPVTMADRQAEKLMRERIAAAFPQDGILGEEFPEVSGTSGYRWLLDPIDGTKSFVRGVPLGTLVGVEHDGRSVVGVIYISGLDECVYAQAGGGAAWYLTGGQPPQRAAVSTRRRLAEALFCTSDVATFEQAGRREVHDRLLAAVQLARTWGDCYGYLLVATGRAEVMIDPVMSLWDAAALQPILEEAGGTFTDWQGRPTIHAGEGVATNGHVLEEVLSLTRGH